MSPSRKEALRTFAFFPTAVAAGMAFPDERKTTKAAVEYQNTPKNGQLCATCLYYVPASGRNGSCYIVEGAISPEGWCADYAAKPIVPSG